MNDRIPASGVSIRKFRQDDTGRVREIACKTAFSGLTSERPVIDENLLADLLTLYYTRFEPESVLVADSEGKAVGYIMGSVNHGRFLKKTVRIFLSDIAPGIIMARYKKIPKTLPLLLFAIMGLIKGERDPDMGSAYPAHLHINIEESYQGSGLGSGLMAAWLRYLEKKHVKGVWLSTVSINEKAIPFFEKWGFKLFCSYRSTFWSFVNGKAVYVKIFAKRIVNENEKDFYGRDRREYTDACHD